MKKSTLSFLLLFLTAINSVYSGWSWKDTEDDINGLSTCSNPETKEQCKNIKKQFNEFREAFDSVYEKDPREKKFIDHKYFSTIADQALLEKVVKSSKELKLRRALGIGSLTFYFTSTDAVIETIFIKWLDNIQNGESITLKDFIIERLKEKEAAR
jgi:hypothetical protein